MNLLHQKIYKEVLIADNKLATYILNRTLTTEVDFEEIFISKFGKGDYYNSKVVGYDVDLLENNEAAEDILKWIPKL